VSLKNKITSIQEAKGNRPLAALTAYDYATARILDEVGIDLILVGDSLGMVVLGFPDTTHVTLDMMLHHTAAVARGVTNAIVIGDLPIHSYDSPEQAVKSSAQLVEAGADVVKLEGGINQVEKVRAIVASGIPVMGHHGMLPQRVLEEGGYKKKGKTKAESCAILEGAHALQNAGCFSIVLESVVLSLHKKSQSSSTSQRSASDARRLMQNRPATAKSRSSQILPVPTLGSYRHSPM